jgi:hypothetical protein
VVILSEKMKTRQQHKEAIKQMDERISLVEAREPQARVQSASFAIESGVDGLLAATPHGDAAYVEIKDYRMSSCRYVEGTRTSSKMLLLLCSFESLPVTIREH